MFFFGPLCSKRTETTFSHNTPTARSFFTLNNFSPFFLAPRAQKEPKTPRYFARCDERRGLRALDLRKLLKKFDQNFSKRSITELIT
jgi:hypothetical protein